MVHKKGKTGLMCTENLPSTDPQFVLISVVHNTTSLCFLCRGQEQHIRYEHIYLPEPSSQPEVEYAEIKRPRLEITPEALMRPSTHRPPLPLGPAEDLAKVRLDWHSVHCT